MQVSGISSSRSSITESAPPTIKAGTMDNPIHHPKSAGQ